MLTDHGGCAASSTKTTTQKSQRAGAKGSRRQGHPGNDTPLHPQLPYQVRLRAELEDRYLPVCDGQNDDRRQTTTTTTTTTDTDDDDRQLTTTTVQKYSSCGLRRGLAEYPGGGDGGSGQDVVVVRGKRISLGGRFCNSKKIMMTTKPTTATSSAERTDERKAKSLQDTSLSSH